MIPPVSLLSNLTLYLPFLHYYDIVSYRSELTVRSAPTTNDHHVSSSYDHSTALTSHLSNIIDALHGFAHHSYEDAPLPARTAVETAQAWALAQIQRAVGSPPGGAAPLFGPLFLALAKVAQHRFLSSASWIFEDCDTPPDWNLRVFCLNEPLFCTRRDGHLSLEVGMALGLLSGDPAVALDAQTTHNRGVQKACASMELFARLSLVERARTSQTVIREDRFWLPALLPLLQESWSVSLVFPPTMLLLDRLLGCVSEVSLQLKAPGFVDSENRPFPLAAGSSPIEFLLAVYPYRELVSDFVRARKVPYCNGGVLRVAESLATKTGRREEGGSRSSTRTPRKQHHVLEVGASLGDCLLFLMARHPDWTGTAVEALEPNAELIRRSVELNNWGDRVEVITMAITDRVDEFPELVLHQKPFSRNSASFAGHNKDATQDVVDPQVVPTARLDNVFLFPQKPDVLLLNTNGHEASVLKSIGTAWRPRIVVAQVYTKEHGVARDPAYDGMAVFRWLLEHGYERLRWAAADSSDGIGQSAGGSLFLTELDFQRFLDAENTPTVFDLVGELRDAFRDLVLGETDQLPESESSMMNGETDRCLDLALGETPNTWITVDATKLFMW